MDYQRRGQYLHLLDFPYLWLQVPLFNVSSSIFLLIIFKTIGSKITDAYIEESKTNACIKGPISSTSPQSDTSVLNRDDSANDTTVTVTAFPITNAIVEDVFQYPVASKIDEYPIPKFVDKKPSNAPILPAPVTTSAAEVIHTASIGNSNTALYKVESDASLFNCTNVESGVRKEQIYDLAMNSNPSDNNDLVELERRLAELAKPNTENSTPKDPKEYSL